VGGAEALLKNFTLASLFLPKNIKFIFSEHNVYNRRRSFKIFKILDAFIYSRYYQIICVSKQVEIALVEWLPEFKKKTTIIFNKVCPLRYLRR
jgi:hypothetical protein